MDRTDTSAAPAPYEGPRKMTGPRRHIDLSRFKFEQPPYYTVHETFTAYSRERLIAKGKDRMRAWHGFNLFMDVVPPSQDVTTITTGQVEDYIDMRLAAGKSALTVRRELTFVKAAIGNAHRRNRIKLVPFIELPDGQGVERIPLTEEQYRVVIKQPMSGRLYRFYRVAYYTGHRAEAIEQLTWDRVDFERGTINFNVPGRLVTNKRRNGAFPIPDDFRNTLLAWKAMAKDAFVIGAGSTTYPEARHVVRELCGFTDPRLVPRHCMRTMFATELFEREANPEVVGKLMADDPNTLRSNYVKFRPETLLAVANVRAKQRAK